MSESLENESGPEIGLATRVVTSAGLLAAAAAAPQLLWPDRSKWLWALTGVKFGATFAMMLARRAWPARTSGFVVTAPRRMSFLDGVVMGVVVAPCAEEMAFRLLPRALFGPSWWTGAGAAVLFALVHNPPGKMLRSFPLSQFVGGLFLWGALRVDFGAAVWMHSLHNVCFALAVPTALSWHRSRGEERGVDR